MIYLPKISLNIFNTMSKKLKISKLNLAILEAYDVSPFGLEQLTKIPKLDFN